MQPETTETPTERGQRQQDAIADAVAEKVRTWPTHAMGDYGPRLVVPLKSGTGGTFVGPATVDIGDTNPITEEPADAPA